MKEETKEWRPVVGYEGLYEVSSNGEVKSVKTQRVLKPCKDNIGYLRVYLSNGGLVKYFRIHRLVASAFIKNETDKKDVNHINGIKEDNKLSNLEWATRSENIQHAWAIGLNEGLRNKMSIMKSKQVVDFWTGIFYDSLTDACKATNCNYERSKNQIRKKFKTQRFQYI
jgi:hypothetical protein